MYDKVDLFIADNKTFHKKNRAEKQQSAEKNISRKDSEYSD